MQELVIGKTRLTLEAGDITRHTADAIVNAANPFLRGGGGVDGAIHRAGGQSILRECERIIAQIGRLAPGRAVVTTAGKLSANYVIHTVGPIWRGEETKAANILSAAYQSSLKMADQMAAKSVVFPSISTGGDGYPIQAAASLALKTVKTYLEQNSTGLERVTFVLFTREDLTVYQNALSALAAMPAENT